VGLVTGLVALAVDAAHGVDEVDGGHPLVDAELNFAGEVVEVADQGAEHLAVPWRGLGAHVVDDGLGEVGVEAVGRLCGAVCAVGSAIGAVGGHCDVGWEGRRRVDRETGQWRREEILFASGRWRVAVGLECWRRR